MTTPDYITQHKGLVHLQAKRFTWACGRSEEYDDLVQAGNIGLMYAVEHFKESRGVKFSTFAALCIRTKIQEHVHQCSRTIRLPVSYRRKMWREKKQIHPHGLSLDTDFAESMTDNSTPASMLEAEENEALVKRVRSFIMEHFSGRNQQILIEFYFEGTKQADIGRMMDLSRERVRQVCEEGVQAIRQHLGIEQ